MGTQDILKKLTKELNRGIASEPRAVYLLTEIRKLIEHDNARSKYPDLKFHCDWALHSKLDGRAAQEILRQFDAAHPLLRDQKLGLHNLPPALRSEINRISKMKSFSQDLYQLLEDYKLPPLTKKRQADAWPHFLQLYAKIVEDTPLVVTGTTAQHISKVVIHFQKAKKKLNGETLFAVTWTIHDKNGQSGSIQVFHSYAR